MNTTLAKTNPRYPIRFHLRPWRGDATGPTVYPERGDQPTVGNLVAFRHGTCYVVDHWEVIDHTGAAPVDEYVVPSERIAWTA